MSVNRNAAVLGAFVADALSLGVHWVYNTGVIDKKIGRVERYTDPMTSYHEGKKAGDFTHYGDQTLVLLESVKAVGRFDPRHFAERWRTFFADYTGYFDKATKATLENMNAGQDLTQSGSTSDDLAGASRLAALLPAYPDATASLIDAARAQTAITHTDDRVVASAEFFARTVAAVLAGQAPVAAIEAILRDPGADAPLAQMIEMGLESRRRDTREAIAEFGQMCSVTAGLPGAVHLIVRYPDDYKTAMVENVMAGGDSSARGMLAGMILAAANGSSGIPDAWLTEMAAGNRINALLKN